MATVATRRENNDVPRNENRIDLTPTGLLMEGHSAQNPSVSAMGILRQPSTYSPQLLDYNSKRLHSHPVTLQDNMKIPGGTTVYIGPPAKPIPKQISDAIGAALGKIVEIGEAYLPMVYIKGYVDPPAQVLVVVLDENTPSPHAKITEVLRAVLPTNFHMDITELHPGDTNLPTIRASGTQLNLNRKLM
jgi:hypothetical protein